MGLPARAEAFQTFFGIISHTLCGPGKRFTMEKLLHALENDLGDELP